MTSSSNTNRRITSRIRFMRGASLTAIALGAVVGSSSIAWTAGNISNTPTVTGTTGGGAPVSDTGTTVDVLKEDKAPSLAINKTDSLADNDLSGGPSVGDVITYQITVENDGNVTLDTIALTDTLTDGGGAPLTLTSGPTRTSGDGGVADVLEVGETWTYEATFTLTQDAIDSGAVSNTVSVTADDPQDVDVTGTSDDPDTPAPGDPTTTTLPATPGLAVTKTDAIALGGDGLPSAGDIVSYVVTAANTGNVSLVNVVPTDTLTTAGGPSTLTLVGPSGDADGDGELDPTETWEWTTTYQLTQADVEAGSISNSVSVAAETPGGAPVSDTSDDPDTGAADDPTVTDLPASAALDIAKAASTSGPVAAGDTITYTYTVTNTGNVIVENIAITDVHNGATLVSTDGPDDTTVPYDETVVGTPAPGTTQDAAINGSWDELWPGDQITFTFTYTVTQTDIDNQ